MVGHLRAPDHSHYEYDGDDDVQRHAVKEVMENDVFNLLVLPLLGLTLLHLADYQAQTPLLYGFHLCRSILTSRNQ